MTLESEIAANLAAVKQEIASAAEAAGRNAADIALVAVSKMQATAKVEAAIAAGQREFGENRVQEAQSKFPELKTKHPGLRLHLIGPLQTNKARDAVELFDVIETVDRAKLAKALAKEMERLGRRPECLIQVNTGKEPQKAGIAPEEADAFVAFARDDLGLPVTGMMCIPPIDEEPSLHFALLAEIAARNDLPVLSIGMSADYDVAVRFGATSVRVGTAIFGERPQAQAI